MKLKTIYSKWIDLVLLKNLRSLPRSAKQFASETIKKGKNYVKYIWWNHSKSTTCPKESLIINAIALVLYSDCNYLLVTNRTIYI
jgi:hypothetical protein